MVSNWTISGGQNSSNLYHVTKEGAEYAERNVNGTMGNLLNSYNQNKGYIDEPIRKRLTNSDAEYIAQKNIHGSMANILHTQSKLHTYYFHFTNLHFVKQLTVCNLIHLQTKRLYENFHNLPKGFLD